MWDLRSHFQLLVDQMNLINLDLFVSTGLLYAKSKIKIATYTSHSMTWDSQVDYGTTD